MQFLQYNYDTRIHNTAQIQELQWKCHDQNRNATVLDTEKKFKNNCYEQLYDSHTNSYFLCSHWLPFIINNWTDT